MKEAFSLKFAIENKIQVIKLISMPIEQHLELNFENGIYKPPCKWVINDIYYFLPLREDTIDINLKCFTYIDRIETFGEYLLSELNLLINKSKRSK